MDTSKVPWLNFGVTSSNDPAAPTIKLGRMNEPVEIASTHNSNRLIYGIGATIYGSENLTAQGTGGTTLSTLAGSTWWQGSNRRNVWWQRRLIRRWKKHCLEPGWYNSSFVPTAFGSTWIAIACLPAGSIVKVDRSDPPKLYVWSGNTFYLSTDYLSTDKDPAFKASPAANLTLNLRFQSPFCYEGNIWLAGGRDATACVHKAVMERDFRSW